LGPAAFQLNPSERVIEGGCGKSLMA
jgi:hypothetical protein